MSEGHPPVTRHRWPLENYACPVCGETIFVHDCLPEARDPAGRSAGTLWFQHGDFPHYSGIGRVDAVGRPTTCDPASTGRSILAGICGTVHDGLRSFAGRAPSGFFAGCPSITRACPPGVWFALPHRGAPETEAERDAAIHENEARERGVRHQYGARDRRE